MTWARALAGTPELRTPLEARHDLTVRPRHAAGPDAGSRTRPGARSGTAVTDAWPGTRAGAAAGPRHAADPRLSRLPRVLLSLLLVSGCAAGAPDEPVPLAYSERGSGPVVVLLHGHPQTAGSWRAVVPALARTHRVIVVDQRGQGASPAPDDGYDAQTRARDVAALLRRLGVARAAVVGADLGGQAAYALARNEPALVDRLAVLEAVVPGTRAAAGPL